MAQVGRRSEPGNFPFNFYASELSCLREFCSRLYIIPSPSPNAFATGRDPQHASVAVTEGIMHLLNEQELKGVLAHELSHVKNRDILLATIAATIASAVTMLARMIQWAAIFGGGRDSEAGEETSCPCWNDGNGNSAPLAATLLQLVFPAVGITLRMKAAPVSAAILFFFQERFEN